MGVSLPILLHILYYVSLLASCAYSQNQTISPNCLSKCGEVNVPYPFGVGEGCFRDKGYEILCNNTNNSSRLAVTGHEVKSISMSQVVVSSLSKTNCDSRNSRQAQLNNSRPAQLNVPLIGIYNLTHSPFTLSNIQNKFFAVGCDIYAQISETPGTFSIGCVSLCPNGFTDMTNRSCLGTGCCQLAIPMGVKELNFTVDSINALSRQWPSTDAGCRYAAVQDSFLSLTVVFDWAIGEKTCKEAKNSTSYACKANSYCVDSINGHGYSCNCSRGYTGNPYVQNGCQDINECKALNNCIKEADCINEPGSYSCLCPLSYNGDGRRNGTGCKLADSGNRITVVFIGIGVSVGVLVLFALSFISYRELKKRKQIKLKQRFYKRNGGLMLEQQISSGEGTVEKIKIFVAEELKRATDNFNESRILGRGGSGTVYKGMLSDGSIVAIKKSKVVDESQISQFINELVILSQIKHRHIVRLLGCCLETEVPLVAYEFISNGTLSHHLHDEDCKSSISWDNRLRIAIEVAGALSYMHSSVATPIFHRDIKSNNILLDENFKAKVSDFGISRSVPNENTHLTTIVQGTFGYLDPEYFHSSQFTDKSDVYSFGVVLVELLTGQTPILSTGAEEEKSLARHFISSMKENLLFEIVEPRVLIEGSREELLAVAKLAKKCLKILGKKRPTMREVAIQLEQLRLPEKQECIPQTQQDYWLYDLSNASMNGPESEEMKMI